MRAYIKNAFLILILSAIAISAFNCDDIRTEKPLVKNSGENKQTYSDEYLTVSKVIDGDTFRMSNGEKVRLIGIDTPEKYDSDKLDRESSKTGRDKQTIKKLGEAASDYVTKLVEGKKVRLEKDPGYDNVDKYNRLLRYVYFEDGTLVNAKILEDGYANVFYDKSISKINEFKKLESDARKNKKGLWGEVDGTTQF
ncbi:MAG: thermonuclease family protein [bacterium]|nr:thermonuclease family protein [bacterium]